MHLILLGAPGAGKGTQGSILAERLGVPKIATGDILREAVRAGTELGREAQRFMDAGELVPDDVILGLVREALRSARARSRARSSTDSRAPWRRPRRSSAILRRAGRRRSTRWWRSRCRTRRSCERMAGRRTDPETGARLPPGAQPAAGGDRRPGGPAPGRPRGDGAAPAAGVRATDRAAGGVLRAERAFRCTGWTAMRPIERVQAEILELLDR